MKPMPARKAAALTKSILTIVKDSLDESHSAKGRSPLRELLLGVLSEDMTDRSATMLINRIEKHFVDWNEVRVSSLHEIAAVISESGDNIALAHQLRTVVERVFDVCNDLDMVMFADLGQRDASRHVSGFIRRPKTVASMPAPFIAPIVAPEAEPEEEEVVEVKPAAKRRDPVAKKTAAKPVVAKKVAAKSTKKAAPQKAATKKAATKKAAKKEVVKKKSPSGAAKGRAKSAAKAKSPKSKSSTTKRKR
jgi:hypothetical protein